MKKIMPLILVILFSVQCLNAKDIDFDTQKLAVTAKVWGFLKYYHPEVAEGNYNWDQELFEILPKVDACSNYIELSELFLSWLDELGEIPNCRKCQRAMKEVVFGKNFNLSWLKESTIFTSELTEKLLFIEQNRHQGEKFYVKYGPANNILLNNETEYKGFDWANKEMRLLTLFRYWNIIEYFFPYKYQMDKDWDMVLMDMIPVFLYSETEQDFHLAMLELIVSLDDGHAGLRTPLTSKFFGEYWAPEKIKIMDNKAVVSGFFNDSLARINRMKTGDIILTVNGRKVEDIFNEKKKYLQGSNLISKQRFAYYAILNGSTDSVDITFLRDGDVKMITLKRYQDEDLGYRYKTENNLYKTLKGNIGYINMGALEPKDVHPVMDSLHNTKGIILDLRNYPKGTLYNLAYKLSSHKREFYKLIYPNLDYPGQFLWRTGKPAGHNGNLIYTGKVVLLVDENSLSHSEFTIMCLQTGDNVTTIGSQTAGADGNVSRINMVGGYPTGFSGLGIFYPDETEAQRHGVKIDIEVKPTIEGIRAGKDEVLERAMEFLSDAEVEGSVLKEPH